MEKLKMKKIINYFTYKYQGNWDDIYEAIQRKEAVNLEQLNNFSDVDNETSYISIVEDQYPENFKNIYMPPLTIYFSGNKDILNHKQIISLWGDVDEENFKKLTLIYNTFAFKYNDKHLKLAKKYANNDIYFILVDSNGFNKESSAQLKQFKNIIYISEIPSQNNIKVNQNPDRLVLGISNKSIFFNTDHEAFEAYKDICKFEKTKMLVIGNIDEKYLTCATKYCINN